MKVYGVIMAGGGGTRFWPLSRKHTPKQLLNLSGREIMVNEAIARLTGVANSNDIFIVTNAAQKDLMIKCVGHRVLENHILSESAARNTSACIGYAAMEILHKYGDGIMVITPSDAYIRDDEKFAGILKEAIIAAETTDKLVTIGINPTFPSTGYGYIEYDKSSIDIAKPVKRFVEKPSLKKASEYIGSGNFVWNSGMFVWKASTILRKFSELLPEVYTHLLKISEAFGNSNEKELIAEIYHKIPAVSVDYGIMEKCSDILVVPGEFGWNDVGSWDTFDAVRQADNDGNIQVGDVLLLDSKNTTAYSNKKLIAAVGVDNLVIVETDDCIMVCSKERAQDVKKIVDKLKEEGREELL